MNRQRLNGSIPNSLTWLLALLLVLIPIPGPTGGSGDGAEPLFWTDIATKRMWYRHGYRSYQNRYGGVSPANWKSINEWIRTLNADRLGGFSDWRLPSAREYATLFREEAGAAVQDNRNVREIELYRLGYRPEIKGLKRYAWTSEEKGHTVVCYDFVEGRSCVYEAGLDVTYEFDALAVRIDRAP